MVSYSNKIHWLRQAQMALPEYAELVPLFAELFRYLEEKGETGIEPRIKRQGLKERLENGFPLLSSGDLEIDVSVCTEFLKGAIGVLSQSSRNGADGLTDIGAALTEGRLDPARLIRAILGRERIVIEEAAQATGTPAPLVEYLFEIPLKAALERCATGFAPEELDGWKEAYCPVCGSRPAMAEIAGDEGRRFLSCSACTYRWPFKRLQCPCCGNEEVKKLGYFTAGEGATRVDTCTACSRYIKTRDSRKGHADVPLDVEDLLTIHLDLLAAREGFERGR